MAERRFGFVVNKKKDKYLVALCRADVSGYYYSNWNTQTQWMTEDEVRKLMIGGANLRDVLTVQGNSQTQWMTEDEVRKLMVSDVNFRNAISVQGKLRGYPYSLDRLWDGGIVIISEIYAKGSTGSSTPIGYRYLDSKGVMHTIDKKDLLDMVKRIALRTNKAPVQNYSYESAKGVLRRGEEIHIRINEIEGYPAEATRRYVSDQRINNIVLGKEKLSFVSVYDAEAADLLRKLSNKVLQEVKEAELCENDYGTKDVYKKTLENERKKKAIYIIMAIVRQVCGAAIEECREGDVDKVLGSGFRFLSRVMGAGRFEQIMIMGFFPETWENYEKCYSAVVMNGYFGEAMKQKFLEDQKLIQKLEKMKKKSN
jgi:hypothetical protein